MITNELTREQSEVSARCSEGNQPYTLDGLVSELSLLGYRLDRSMDYVSTHKWMTGTRKGASYVATAMYVREKDTGLLAMNVSARRDARFEALQSMRFHSYAISAGKILEL